MKKLTETNTFKEGDIICSKNNYDFGLYFFAAATDRDVKNYSGGSNQYYRIEEVEGNPVPSLDNNEIKFIIKVLEDNIIRIPTEKGSPESIISSIHNKRYKQLISKLQNGRETDKEQPNCKNWPEIKCPEEGCAYPDCGNENF